MKIAYEHLIHPELYYETPQVAKFIDSVRCPEVSSIAATNAITMASNMCPADDFMCCLQRISEEAQLQIKENDELVPFFAIVTSKSEALFMRCPNLKNHEDSEELYNKYLQACKCHAYVMCAQAVFFVSETAFIKEDQYEGIHIIGSTIQGNSLRSETAINRSDDEVTFSPLYKNIKKEEDEKCPIGKFFRIKDENDLVGIISNLPKVREKSPLIEEREAIINFATMLASLFVLSYEG